MKTYDQYAKYTNAKKYKHEEYEQNQENDKINIQKI